MADAPLIPGTLALDCYPNSAQAFYDEMFARGHAVVSDVLGLLIQDAAPDPIYQTGPLQKGWIPTAGNVPIYPGYVFVWHATFGHWVARNPIGASDPSRRIFMGLSTDVGTYDGGDAGAPTIGSGPMWEIDAQFAGSVPVGVGLIPGSAATIAEPAGQVGKKQDSLGASGEYAHVLANAEVAGHWHGVGTDGHAGGGDPPIMLHRDWNVAPDSYTERLENTAGTETWADGAATSAGVMGTTDAIASATPAAAHNTMQPYVGVYFIKRTARQFYVM